MLISHKASYIIKIGTALAGRAIVSPLCLLPIQKKRVLFQSFREKQYACNPRYISEALERLCPGELEIGWAFRQPEKFAYLRERHPRDAERLMGSDSVRAHGEGRVREHVL